MGPSAFARLCLRLVSSTSAACATLAFTAPPAGAAPMFLPLGSPPGQGCPFSSAVLSADGSTVAVAELCFPSVGRWRAGTGWQTIVPIPDYTTQVRGISATGGVIVGELDEGSVNNGPDLDPTDVLHTRTFRFVDGTDPPAPPAPCSTGSFEALSAGVSASGDVEARTVACFSGTSRTIRATRYEAGVGWESVGTLPGSSFSRAISISRDGGSLLGWSDAHAAGVGRERAPRARRRSRG